MMSEDLIKREDAITAVMQCTPFETKGINLIGKCEEQIKAIPSADRPQVDEFKNFDRESLILLIECQKERIGELLADRPQEWIPCSERLPSKGVAVLVNGTMYDAPPITISTDAPYYYERGWINAWMPLPKPWKGADDEV